MSDNSQDLEAIERRRSQNRIAQRKHRQRRAQLLRECHAILNQRKEGGSDNQHPDHLQQVGSRKDYSRTNSPEAVTLPQFSQHCIGCQSNRRADPSYQEHQQHGPQLGTSSHHASSLNHVDDNKDSASTPPFQDNVEEINQSALQRSREVVQPSPLEDISANLTGNDGQYFLDATTFMTSANFFQDSLLETADDKEQIEDPSQHNINKSQTVNPIARAKLSNPNKRPRSASYCPPVDTGHHPDKTRDPSSSRRATFTALASPPISDPALSSTCTSPVISRQRHKGKTALHICAERGDEEVVRALVLQGITLDVQDSFGFTALHYAAQNSHYKVAKILLQGGADTEILNEEGYSVLHVAAEVGSLDVITLLSQEGADLNSRVGTSIDD
ncbi:Ankyrin repeat-containing protein [Glarea lozoyensis ATCC 20868]|uniref:Ankyrin repeat-containing protein n=1 Tax=Glarea lozoyensis (strain ATCC 20868 / MF5171) TaxID=1116229 RepID=S3CW35_GLAL2|nr:Ankyrin repeat-containing protein [Glarea lozoyensis ATCC 20868]EPE30617.1 Ankyrin repeat-containing protein [Glarea lozoyensis ATCC 20868]